MERAVESMSSLRNVSDVDVWASNRELSGKSPSNAGSSRASTAFSSPRVELPLPDESRSDKRVEGKEIEPEWSQLVRKADSVNKVGTETDSRYLYPTAILNEIKL
jgi:hypothetical protein